MTRSDPTKVSALQVATPSEAVIRAAKRVLMRWLMEHRSSRRTASFAVIPGDWISNEIIVQGLYEEPYLASLFEMFLAEHRQIFSEGTAIDVGANIGNHSLYFARYFKKVIAFEPNPTALAILRCNVELHPELPVKFVPVGLGEENGIRTFSQSTSGDIGCSHFSDDSGVTGRAIQCDIRTGDSILTPEMLAGPVRLIKLDIEGGELSALKGLTSTIVSNKPLILFESNTTGGPTGGAEVVKYLRSLGYEYFYSLDRNSEHLIRVVSMIKLIIWGERISAVPIQNLAEKRYSCVVASFDPL